MSYLDRLREFSDMPDRGTDKTPKTLDDPRNFQNAPGSVPTKPPKPEAQSSSVGFVGTPPGPFQKIEGADSPVADPLALPDAAMGRRRQAVLHRLREHPAVRYAFETAQDGAGNMRVALAIRGTGSCELVVPADRWDPILFLELLNKHGGQA